MEILRFEKRIGLSENKPPLATMGLLVFIHLKARNDASSPHKKHAACMADTTEYGHTKDKSLILCRKSLGFLKKADTSRTAAE